MSRAFAYGAPSPADAVQHDPREVFAAGERNHHVSNTAYPLAHETTWKPYRVTREKHDALTAEAFEGIDSLCLYAHIPFCEVRCSFCEYTVVSGDDLRETERYMDALERELDVWATRLGRRTLHGFDIGGGTPAFVSEARIERFVERVRERFVLRDDAGISIEATPRIAAARPEMLHAWRASGIDRVSMGIQVIQPDLLRVLRRDGNGVEHHHRAVENIRNAGFTRLNLDLMYGFADQSLASFEATVAHALGLGPEYITLYRMRYKLTRISDQASRVDRELVRAQAKLAKAMLHAAGYAANPGKNTYSRVEGDIGTSEYLTRRVVDGMPYLGVGLGAQTFTHRTISYADGAIGKNLAPYFDSLERGRLPLQDLYDLPACQAMAKMVAVSFYFGEVDLDAFAHKFGVTLEQAYPNEVSFALSEGLMAYADRPAMPRSGIQAARRTFALTPHGADNFHGVIALFFAPSIKAYLIGRDDGTDFAKQRRLALRVAAHEGAA
jgi:oxygen-independent coproporphyrinogen-3 oxidase